MKHAGTATLARLAPLLADLRGLPGLVERKPGVFYRRGKAWLHFHEDPAGLFADVRLDQVEFERFSVDSEGDQAQLLARVRASLEA